MILFGQFMLMYSSSSSSFSSSSLSSSSSFSSSSSRSFYSSSPSSSSSSSTTSSSCSSSTTTSSLLPGHRIVVPASEEEAHCLWAKGRREGRHVARTLCSTWSDISLFLTYALTDFESVMTSFYEHVNRGTQLKEEEEEEDEEENEAGKWTTVRMILYVAFDESIIHTHTWRLRFSAGSRMMELGGSL